MQYTALQYYCMQTAWFCWLALLRGLHIARYMYLYVCMTLYVCTSASYISLINYKGTYTPPTYMYIQTYAVHMYMHAHNINCWVHKMRVVKCTPISVTWLQHRPELFLPIGDQVTLYYRNYHYSQVIMLENFVQQYAVIPLDIIVQVCQHNATTI